MFNVPHTEIQPYFMSSCLAFKFSGRNLPPSTPSLLLSQYPTQRELLEGLDVINRESDIVIIVIALIIECLFCAQFLHSMLRVVYSSH